MMIIIMVIMIKMITSNPHRLTSIRSLSTPTFFHNIPHIPPSGGYQFHDIPPFGVIIVCYCYYSLLITGSSRRKSTRVNRYHFINNPHRLRRFDHYLPTYPLRGLYISLYLTPRTPEGLYYYCLYYCLYYCSIRLIVIVVYIVIGILRRRSIW